MRKTFIALAMCVTLVFSTQSTGRAASQWTESGPANTLDKSEHALSNQTAPASTESAQKLYAEGEALAIVRGNVQLQGPGRAERIAQVSGGGMDPAVIGGVTIGLFAAAVLLLTGMRKKRSE